MLVHIPEADKIAHFTKEIYGSCIFEKKELIAYNKLDEKGWEEAQEYFK